MSAASGPMYVCALDPRLLVHFAVSPGDAKTDCMFMDKKIKLVRRSMVNVEPNIFRFMDFLSKLMLSTTPFSD
jgi:hypothetical protein